MSLRRVTGVLVALLLLHLTWVGNVSACEDIVDHSATVDASAAVSNAHAGHGASHETRPSAPSDESTIDPCCTAMATCAIALISIDRDDRALMRDDAGAARGPLRRAPLASLRAPEPPPPRA